ncbi:MAG TPA: ABC transporter ATP-binding protein [Conexibacter sp.]|nr:ABC transporter ATP-binding protein [Conexibacter sp.]
MPAVLELHDVAKTYAHDGTVVEALRGVTLSVEPNRLVAIVGPSGSGKSTLLNLLGTLDAPTRGRLRFDGRDVTDLDSAARARFRARHVGFVFQFFNLLPGLTAAQNVELAAAIAGGDRGRSRARTRELLAQMGLADQRDMPARRLSGGQMQRVAIARALVNDPRLVLADEPTGNLDRRNAEQTLALLREHAVGDRAVVMVTHDHELAERYADEVVTLVDGRVREDAPVPTPHAAPVAGREPSP